ncbi:LacI family DNA-binding transcriptional regulator [Plantactinospora sp. BB1]|uniref:LacI family DNA-binding transcriptional regulator n=1 Tax=Plantactinospora sp. BB1 TaxID=2071627 RepID=UPI000D17CEC8|nr:LacI family DNA-binding transcriptional regulator [Plantactinospora sp. BB1]AVT38507.1 LacI family transcriptional regulator [Plantactinospora sp. BB1]
MPSRAPRRATLEDVARVAGVSRSTASRVIAGYGAASATARDRVVAAAAQLGYAPDPAARALATGAGVRLVVAVAGTAPTVLHDPYVDRVVRAAAEVCAPREVGVSLEWLPLHAPARLRQLAEDRGVRGVLMINTTEPILAAVPAGLQGRTVSIGIGSRSVPSFDVDNGGAARTIVGHLLASGRRRIAMITGPEWMPCSRRPVIAYREAMRAAGRPIRLVPGDFTAPAGQAAMLTILARWPDTDAVFANSDAMALGALAVLRRRGIDVPGDIAVAGFDDVPFAALSAPALTTASHPVEQIATAAATAVLDRAWVPPATAYPSELILRESA